MSASFVYDALDRRMSKTIGTTTTQFLYDVLNPVQELRNGSPSANLLTGLNIDEYFSRSDSSGSMSFLRDALGSTLALTNSSGNITTSYTYEPFGNARVNGSNTNPYQFTGRENDVTGLYFYRARYYSPTFQRFIAQDPIGFAAGDTNAYSYVLNEPLEARDPTGRWVIGIFVGGAVGAAEGAIGARLQGGATSDIITSAVIGALLGGTLGAFDPTEGALTAGNLAGIGAGAGLLGDVAGQLIGNGGSCLNISEAVGAGLGGAAAGAIGAATTGMAAALGASELGQVLAALGFSAAPSTLGGPIGAAFGLTIQFPRPMFNIVLSVGPSR